MGALARAATWLLPEELLRPAARAQLRLRGAARRRTLAGVGRRPRPAAERAGPEGHHGVLDRPRRRGLPGRHGLLAGEVRPGLCRDVETLARPARLAGGHLS